MDRGSQRSPRRRGVDKCHRQGIDPRVLLVPLVLVSKAEKREERKRLQEEQFERAKAKFLAQVQVSGEPKIAHLPSAEKLRLAVGVDPATLDIPQQPRVSVSGSILHLQVTWCVRKRDVAGTWSWQEMRLWSDHEWEQTIHPAFDQFERLTWAEVQKQISGEGHLMHHEHELPTVCEEAQARWIELGLEEFDTLFRFRLGNTRRFWGFRIGGHFFGVWWEREHNIYPTGT